MKKIGFFVFLMVLAACSSNPVNDCIPNTGDAVGGTVGPLALPLNVSDNENRTGGTCLHKYDSERNFRYVGKIKAFKQVIFGQEVYVFEHIKPDGSKVYLSQDEILNYECERY